MPLIKRTNQTDTPSIPPVREPSQEIKQAVVSIVNAMEKATGINDSSERHSKASVPMTKDGYWERKEARDIRTGECIRLSGVLQALLSSVNYGQYCTTADKAAYLAEVKKDAKELAKFITEEA